MSPESVFTRAAFVSGGASGLGAACVRALVDRGAHVLIADRDSARGEALAGELGERARFVATDVTDEASVLSALAAAPEIPRIVITCAGVGAALRMVDRDGSPHSLAAFQRVIDVNLIGTFNVVRLASAVMARAEPINGERGVIVQTSSIAAYDGQIGQVAYAASKAAIAGMTLPLARELAKLAIRVCTICPGTMDTPLLAGLPEAARKSLEATIPFPGRLGLPAEFASLALQIVENRYLNGECIRLDGALRMPAR